MASKLILHSVKLEPNASIAETLRVALSLLHGQKVPPEDVVRSLPTKLSVAIPQSTTAKFVMGPDVILVVWDKNVIAKIHRLRKLGVIYDDEEEWVVGFKLDLHQDKARRELRVEAMTVQDAITLAQQMVMIRLGEERIKSHKNVDRKRKRKAKDEESKDEESKDEESKEEEDSYLHLKGHIELFCNGFKYMGGDL